MSEPFYSDARLYDRLFLRASRPSSFYRAAAELQGGSVLELGSGTGRKLIPIAADGDWCVGLEPADDCAGLHFLRRDYGSRTVVGQ